MVGNRKEKYTTSSPEPVSLKQTEVIVEQMKSNTICRINNKGIGFFVKIPYRSKILPVIITTNQVINTDDIKNKTNISLYLGNDKTIKTIKLDNKRLMYTNEKFDITIIEIKEKEDNLNNKYLELDDEIINYFKLNRIEKIKNLYNLKNSYYNESIYLLNYHNDKYIYVSYGKFLNMNDTQIIYDCIIKDESSGSPILLINNQKLIGIHCNSSKHNKYNKGMLLIYSIIEFSKTKNNLLIINKKGNNINHNYIIGEFNIKEDEKNIRIINSYEQFIRENKYYKYEKENKNEKEIKDNCLIMIKNNNKLIPFSYFHKFIKKGKYTILYIFKNNITKTNYMFSKCSSLANINLSYFNADNLTNMSNMFNDCSSLMKINFNNFNTNNIINMSRLFYECSSLTNIDLSNFKTNNAKDMSGMFIRCLSLTNIDLSNFNTNNVRDMSFMFWGCSSLTNVNLTNFNTTNVKDFNEMFNYCDKLNKNNIITKDKRLLYLLNNN